jgi:hypothetical protein
MKVHAIALCSLPYDTCLQNKFREEYRCAVLARPFSGVSDLHRYVQEHALPGDYKQYNDFSLAQNCVFKRDIRNLQTRLRDSVKSAILQVFNIEFMTPTWSAEKIVAWRTAAKPGLEV